MNLHKAVSPVTVSIPLFIGLWSLSQSALAQTRAYVANFGSNNVSVIDTSANTVIATVMVGNQPQGIAITPNGAFAYVANCGGDVWVIDTATNKVATKFLVGGCPTAVAFTPDGTRAYVTKANANEVAVIETSSNKVTATIPVQQAPGGIAITPDGAHAYATNVGTGTGPVSVIDTSSNTVATTVQLGNIGPVSVAITPDGTRAYVAGAYGTVAVIDTSSNTVATTVSVPNIADSPVNLAITPDGKLAYVVTYGPGGTGPVAVIDTSSNKVIANVSVGTGPTGIGISPDGTRAYVTIATNVIGSGPGAVTVIDTSSNTVVDTVTGIGSTPFGVAFTPGAVGPATPPAISSGGIVPATVQPGEWVTMYGSNLATATAVWTGNFPISLGGTSVKIDGKAAYLSYVSPGQIDLQVPNDSTTGSVSVDVTTANGTGSSTVTLAQFGPEFFLLDAKHVAGIILRNDGSGAYGGGGYDILGPTGTSLGYKTVAAKAGDTIELFGNGFGPTNPTVQPGQVFSGAAPTTNPVTLHINGVGVVPLFAGLSGAGLYQFNLAVPSGLGTGDVSLQATVGSVETPSGVVISLR